MEKKKYQWYLEVIKNPRIYGPISPSQGLGHIGSIQVEVLCLFRLKVNPGVKWKSYDHCRLYLQTKCPGYEIRQRSARILINSLINT